MLASWRPVRGTMISVVEAVSIKNIIYELLTRCWRNLNLVIHTMHGKTDGRLRRLPVHVTWVSSEVYNVTIN